MHFIAFTVGFLLRTANGARLHGIAAASAWAFPPGLPFAARPLHRVCGRWQLTAPVSRWWGGRVSLTGANLGRWRGFVARWRCAHGGATAALCGGGSTWAACCLRINACKQQRER